MVAKSSDNEKNKITKIENEESKTVRTRKTETAKKSSKKPSTKTEKKEPVKKASTTKKTSSKSGTSKKSTSAKTTKSISPKTETKPTTKSTKKEEIVTKKLEPVKEEKIETAPIQRELTLNELVTKINKEKGNIENPPSEKKDNPLASLVAIALIIAMLWIIIYILFVGPNAKFEIKEKQNNQNEQEIDQTNYDLARKKSSEISAEKVIEAAYLWYTGALMKYETLVDVQVLADGTIAKLNPNDKINLQNEKLNIDTLPTDIDSMVISKEGIIVASKINYNNYCFNYNGDQLTEIEC